MVLGLSSFAYGWTVGTEPDSPRLSAMDLIERTCSYGLKCLQVGDNVPLHMSTSGTLKELKAFALKNNIRLEVGARKLTEDHLQRYLEITRFLEAPLLRFVVDGHGYEPSANAIVSILKNILSELKKSGITLGIENHDRFKAKELAVMIEGVADENVGVCLDCVNSIGAGEGLEWVADILAPYTVNLHIKDFSIRRVSNNMGFTVTGAQAGTGMLNLPWLMEKLEQYGRCCSAVLEQWVPAETNPDKTIEKENNWAEKGSAYLKQLEYFT
jgi:sugar phosphate isomerase/epimerase